MSELVYIVCMVCVVALCALLKFKSMVLEIPGLRLEIN